MFNLLYQGKINFGTNCVSLFFYVLLKNGFYLYCIRSYLSKWHCSFFSFVGNSVTFSFFIVCYRMSVYLIVYFNNYFLMDVDFDFIIELECPYLLLDFIWDENHLDFILNVKYFMSLCLMMMFGFEYYSYFVQD